MVYKVWETTSQNENEEEPQQKYFTDYSTYPKYLDTFCPHQSTLVISTLLISNNRLSGSENLAPAVTWKSNNRSQEEKEHILRFSTIFSVYL